MRIPRTAEVRQEEWGRFSTNALHCRYVPRSDRITPAMDLSRAALDSERRFEAAGSDVRMVLPTRMVPWLVLTYDELRLLPLNSRDGFVLSLVDGRCTVEMILDIAGMPEDDVVDVLHKLAELGAIELRDR